MRLRRHRIPDTELDPYKLQYATLKGLTRRQVVILHDKVAGGTGPIETPFYLNELARQSVGSPGADPSPSP